MSTESTTPELSPEQQRHREWVTWMTDFGNRYPAVRGYVQNQGVQNGGEAKRALLHSWEQSLQAFAMSTLRDVTQAIIDGRLEPIANEQLGQFADEIRKRARTVREWERKQEQQPWQEGPTRRQFLQQMLNEPSMAWMYRCCLMARELAMELPSNPSREDIDRIAMAAITLADKHTPTEETAALKFLEVWGLTWTTIQERAACRAPDPIVHREGDTDGA